MEAEILFIFNDKAKNSFNIIPFNTKNKKEKKNPTQTPPTLLFPPSIFNTHPFLTTQISVVKSLLPFHLDHAYIFDILTFMFKPIKNPSVFKH